MPAAVDTSLTKAMLNRLTRIDDEHREKAPAGGNPKDPSRLCNSWKGALAEDKVEPERFATDPDIAGKLTAGKIREEHPKCRIYTAACMQNAIGNCRKKAKKAVDDREDSECKASCVGAFDATANHCIVCF